MLLFVYDKGVYLGRKVRNAGGMGRSGVFKGSENAVSGKALAVTGRANLRMREVIMGEECLLIAVVLKAGVR